MVGEEGTDKPALEWVGEESLCAKPHFKYLTNYSPMSYVSTILSPSFYR